jgi:hypothetical protein
MMANKSETCSGNLQYREVAHSATAYCRIIYMNCDVSEIAFRAQPIWKFLGNRLVEAHVRGNLQAKETELVQVGISFAVLSCLLKFRSARGREVESSSYNEI